MYSMKNNKLGLAINTPNASGAMYRRNGANRFHAVSPALHASTVRAAAYKPSKGTRKKTHWIDPPSKSRPSTSPFAKRNRRRFSRRLLSNRYKDAAMPANAKSARAYSSHTIRWPLKVSTVLPISDAVWVSPRSRKNR
jgi:hypothetical protein